ncbi:MAG: phosphatidate cytidylyltransferase [Peptococcaceae bacterium]|jgi:phosphatidate cytidylyltransferase|nr:phosphatidate cytidylyltransferase [Peptococcaceae bacterium]
MVKRIVSAAVGVPVILGLIYLGRTYFLVGIMLLSLLAMVELGRMLKRIGLQEMRTFLYTAAFFFPLILYFETTWLPSFLVMFVLSGALIMIKGYPELRLQDLSANFMAILYVAFGFAHMVLLRKMEQGMILSAYAFVVVWLTDSGSYLVGTYLGKHPFFREISPSKTLEGAIGGVITGAVGAALFCAVLGRYLPIENVGLLVALSPVLSVAGQAGDLFESALKRQARIKDSSRIIPGHGGILDRFDSALWVIPLLYHILWLRANIFI